MKKKYYKSFKEFKKEKLPTYGKNLIEHFYKSKISRRRFLSLLATYSAFALMTGCFNKGRGTLNTPSKSKKGLTYGKPLYYATAYSYNFNSYPVLIKTREGRPIFVQKNEEFGFAPPFRALAELINLYHPERLKKPEFEDKKIDYDIVFDKLNEIVSKKEIFFFLEPSSSPTKNKLIKEIKEKFSNVHFYFFDPFYFFEKRKAEEEIYGKYLKETHNFSVNLLVSFENDFLGADDPVNNLRYSISKENPEFQMIYLGEEINITSSKADIRISIPQSFLKEFLLLLLEKLLEKKDEKNILKFLSNSGLKRSYFNEDLANLAIKLKNKIEKNQGKILFLFSDYLRRDFQALGILFNELYGLKDSPSNFFEEEEVILPEEAFDIIKNSIDKKDKAIIFSGVDPFYFFPSLKEKKRNDNFVFIGNFYNDTSEECSLIIPSSHMYESFGDFYFDGETILLRQKAIEPLYSTFPEEEILIKLFKIGGENFQYLDYLKKRWKEEVFDKESGVDFDIFFRNSLKCGYCKKKENSKIKKEFNLSKCLNLICERDENIESFKLKIIPSRTIFDGRYSKNIWLLELPNPITKMTWTNCLIFSAFDAEKINLKEGEIVSLSCGEKKIEAPVYILPGQMKNTILIEAGFGKNNFKVSKNPGVNPFFLIDFKKGKNFVLKVDTISKIGKKINLPSTQYHHSIEGEEIVKSFKNKKEFEEYKKVKFKEEHPSLYKDIEYKGEKWGMVIDLSKCIGCSACVIGCMAENNIPVVGPEEVSKGREMHWIRIDRYFEGEGENLNVFFLPMLCQQCDNAPCENVCPVNATVHSEDGLNQMVYNRCVGTRYCANNCPYKVRRFNFFDFHKEKKEPQILVFNPEVSIRPRGVMEKCTFCVQRIEEARMVKKSGGKEVKIEPACMEICPTKAIMFGNILDEDSEIKKKEKDERAYKVLEELGVKPQVIYLAEVKNGDE